MKFAGALPMKNSREIDRAAVAAMFGWTAEEVYDAASAFKALHRRQADSTITFEQYLRKMAAADLRPEMIGKAAGDYQLARVGDVGGYHDHNTRFITSEMNIVERAEVYQRRPASRENASAAAKARQRRTCEHCGLLASPQMIARWHGPRCKEKAP